MYFYFICSMKGCRDKMVELLSSVNTHMFVIIMLMIVVLMFYKSNGRRVDTNKREYLFPHKYVFVKYSVWNKNIS